MAYLDRLQKDLAACVEAGILSASQAQNAVAHIEQRHPSGGLKGVTWIAIFAGLSIAVGVILVVSHNWEHIPAGAKMAGFLMLLTIAGSATLATRDRSPAVNVPLELVWLFMPLVGIGLYAQIFQLSGDPVKPYLTWLVLGLPLAWLSPHRVTPTVHVAGLLAVLWFGTMSRDGMLSLVRAQAPAWVLAAGVLGTAAALARRRLSAEHQVSALGAALAWVLALMASDTPIRARQAGFLFAAAVALSTLWLAAAVALSSEEKPRSMPRAAWLFAVYVGTFLWHDQNLHRGVSVTTAGMSLAAVLAMAAAAAVVGLPGETLSRDGRRVLWGKALLLFSLVLPFGALSEPRLVGALCNAVLVAAAVGLMWNGSVEGRVSQINAGVAVLFAVILTRFIDVFGSLLQGGVAFIAAGLALAGLAYVLHKGRQSLVERAREAA